MNSVREDFFWRCGLYTSHSTKMESKWSRSDISLTGVTHDRNKLVKVSLVSFSSCKGLKRVCRPHRATKRTICGRVKHRAVVS